MVKSRLRMPPPIKMTEKPPAKTSDHEPTRRKICEIGRRLCELGLVVASDGNISARISADEILCTPTGISKGQMQPDDLCTLDLSGNQIGGTRRPSSESRLHLEIYRQRSDVTSVIHAHPPHATAFAITRQAIPAGILPEVELFLGEIPIAGYATPGTDALAESVVPFLDLSKVVVLANHGTVSYEKGPDCVESLERSLWWTEILENYARVLLLSRSVGAPAYLTNDELRDVIRSKAKWGIPDPRMGEDFQNSDLRHNPVFNETWESTGISRDIFPAPDNGGDSNGGCNAS